MNAGNNSSVTASWLTRDEIPRLEEALLNDVLFELQLGRETPSLPALGRIYRSWAGRLGMENLSKRLSLLRHGVTPRARMSLEPAFENFLNYGTCGTCWTTMEMFIALLRACDYDARPRLGEMTDPGLVNHGSVVVLLDDTVYSVDQNLLWPEPLPLNRGETTSVNGPLYQAEARYDAGRAGFHIRRFTASHEFKPTFLVDGEPQRADYFPFWQGSYKQSHFNEGYFINRTPSGTWRQLNNRKFSELEPGNDIPARSEPPVDDLPAFIEEKFGLSASIMHHVLRQERG